MTEILGLGGWFLWLYETKERKGHTSGRAKCCVNLFVYLSSIACLPVCVFVRLPPCATIWVVLMAGLMVIPLSHKSVSGARAGS